MATKRYRVEVCRIGYGFAEIIVEAENKKDAGAKAEEEAGNYYFSEKTSDYQIEDVEEIKEE